jgi:hypothetical protein
MQEHIQIGTDSEPVNQRISSNSCCKPVAQMSFSGTGTQKCSTANTKARHAVWFRVRLIDRVHFPMTSSPSTSFLRGTGFDKFIVFFSATASPVTCFWFQIFTGLWKACFIEIFLIGSIFLFLLSVPTSVRLLYNLKQVCLSSLMLNFITSDPPWMFSRLVWPMKPYSHTLKYVKLVILSILPDSKFKLTLLFRATQYT